MADSHIIRQARVPNTLVIFLDHVCYASGIGIIELPLNIKYGFCRDARMFWKEESTIVARAARLIRSYSSAFPSFSDSHTWAKCCLQAELALHVDFSRNASNILFVLF